ncbi:MAG TPA: hypothetical protein VFS43_21200 [Polyangiaceae bacterium]|nr:hypothetical protein [Polyangiaceae bacterium]
MRGLWVALVAGSATVAACDTGVAVGGGPAAPPAPSEEEGPPKSSEPKVEAPTNRVPIVAPALRPAAPAEPPAYRPPPPQPTLTLPALPALQPALAVAPPAEAPEPPRPPVWRRFDIGLFSVEMPAAAEVERQELDGGERALTYGVQFASGTHIMARVISGVLTDKDSDTFIHDIMQVIPREMPGTYEKVDVQKIGRSRSAFYKFALASGTTRLWGRFVWTTEELYHFEVREPEGALSAEGARFLNSRQMSKALEGLAKAKKR